MHRIVLANGVFDMLHVAHVRHLEEAKRMGTLLVVGLTSDAAVGKGPGRPIIKQGERMEMLQALRCVYEVRIVNSSLEALAQWKPAIFAKGHDRKEIGLMPEEIAYCEAHKIEVRFTSPNPQTTSKIVEMIKCAA